MMNGITGFSQAAQGPQPNRAVTEEQSQKLTEFLADYDTSNLNEEDATEIVAQVKALGINPGAGLADVLSASGIDAKALAEQAGIGKVEGAGGPPGVKGGPGGPPPAGGSGGRADVDDTLVSLFSDAVEAYEADDEAESLWDVLEPALQSAGYDTSKSVIDFRA